MQRHYLLLLGFLTACDGLWQGLKVFNKTLEHINKCVFEGECFEERIHAIAPYSNKIIGNDDIFFFRIDRLSINGNRAA